MIKNYYSIVDDTAVLHITRRNGDKFDVIIDLEDLEVLDKINLKVHVSWHKKILDYYAEICQYIGNKNTGSKHQHRTILLQRLLTNAEKGTHVDHRNHKTLDNRKSNLRVSKVEENCQHRSGKNSNNKSGYRNVCFIDGKYIVQLQVNGKNTRLKSFDDVHEAGKYAEEKRKEIYGEYNGKN